MITLWTLAREAIGAVALGLRAERTRYVVTEDPDALGYYAVPLPTSAELDTEIRRLYADEV